MRLAEKELRIKYPSFNFDSFQSVFYGDVPKETHDEKWLEHINELSNGNDTTSNIFAVSKSIYYKFGIHDYYYTLKGEIGIKNNVALYGQISIKYSGRVYDFFLDHESLTISHNGEYMTGWRNKSGLHSPSRMIKELDPDMIEKIFRSKDWDDFGTGVQIFKETCKRIYDNDKTNYYSEY